MKQKLKLLYANVRGIKSKMPCIKNVFSETKPDIALFTETHLTEDKGVSVEGYTFFGRPRTTGKGGGVGIFVKNDKKTVIAPHYSDRELEIIWVSVSRESETPLYIGAYYGKQETTCNNATIQEEMDKLSEEILELESDGEVLICMDANAKIGLMQEAMSRNGKLMTAVFQECELEVINGGDKCDGTVTRQNRKRPTEISAIDLVVATYNTSHWIKKMTIDEIGDYRMQGVNESDHNTIIIDLEVSRVQGNKPSKKTMWNIRAPAEKYAEFRMKLGEATQAATNIMDDKNKSMSERYEKWEKLLYKAAISTIGKTTYRPGGPPRTSDAMKALRTERKGLKDLFEKEPSPSKKRIRLAEYVEKQHEIKEEAIKEESDRIYGRFQKMEDNGKSGAFWKERKRMKNDEGSSWLVTKDIEGKRIFDPEKNKENIAHYYEDLYSKKTVKDHPFHTEVSTAVTRLGRSKEVKQEDIDQIPTRQDVKEAIEKKKNGKATTDWKNEVVKRGGDEMVEFVYPVIEAFWNEETAPGQWNTGVITNIWKGKGDRELMANQRGITVSSSISTIAEEIISSRITKMAKFTQSQAGGRKEGSTTDHIFTLKNIITIAKKERRKIIITFYDVVKAYDRADMDDMCYAMYKSGVDGRLWRLMKSINNGLRAKIITKAGLTREIERELGGKQGGKLMVTMFAKMMDNMAEDIMESNLGIDIGMNRIPALIYMDDATTFAEGKDQQEETLKAAEEFAVKHKLEWGPEKCKTMEVGGHKEEKDSWKLGQKTINKCESYKYLGERIHRNGKNGDNLKERCDKLRYTARAIVTCCRNEIMRRIGMKVILKLHEAETIPAFLYNAETWTLNKSEKKIIDQAELYAWKKMIGLPQTTPTAGIIMTTGALFSTIRVEIKQLVYLHKVMNKSNSHWTKTTLMIMKEYNIGWAKQICEILERWELNQNWEEIRLKTPGQWKGEVKRAAEIMNIRKLREECEIKSRGESRQKTKTKFVITSVNNGDYSRGPDKFILQNNSITYTRALIMGRYGMLKCANNFSNGHGTKLCDICMEVDNEDHRINVCTKWEGVNLVNKSRRICFDDIYLNDNDRCLAVVETILSLWDLENGKNEMRQLI